MTVWDRLPSPIAYRVLSAFLSGFPGAPLLTGSSLPQKTASSTFRRLQVSSYVLPLFILFFQPDDILGPYFFTLVSKLSWQRFQLPSSNLDHRMHSSSNFVGIASNLCQKRKWSWDPFFWICFIKLMPYALYISTYVYIYTCVYVRVDISLMSLYLWYAYTIFFYIWIEVGTRSGNFPDHYKGSWWKGFLCWRWYQR